jgi:hypothetical protein
LAPGQGIQEIGGAIKFGHLDIGSANFIQSMGIAASAGRLALFFGQHPCFADAIRKRGAGVKRFDNINLGQDFGRG